MRNRLTSRCSRRPRVVVTCCPNLSPVVIYHGLARRYLLPPGFVMRPQLKGGTLIWNDGSSSKGGFSSFSRSFVALVSKSEVNESAGEVGGLSTVDHADIRGSAGAAFMVIIRRELPRTGL